MELILWRHAEAEDGTGDDMARALTRRGHKQAKLMAAWLRPRLGNDWKILSSPAKRALQTAEALERHLEIRERLDTSCGPADVLRESGWPDAKGSVMVVGHQPTLGQVAAQLLGVPGDVAFRKGAVWWFSTRQRDGGGETVLKAVLNPDLLED
ncbi:histidine phosphatase family protein [Betaproteobacteria bacterium GR16-43]|nr:histidine phosphatase family protein [Betaproteobacteria bacterium GR16-43]